MIETMGRIQIRTRWEMPDTRYLLKANEVHVWQASYEPGLMDAGPGKSSLTDLEITRAEQFCFQEDRNLFIFARERLRLLLSRYLDIQPGAICLETMMSGKPFVSQPEQNPPICFNLSHSGKMVVYAFTWGHEVGIDLECIRAIPDLESLADRYYSTPERELLRAASPEARLRLFLQFWTRKEAYLKALGNGLALLAPGLDASTPPVPVPVLTQFNPKGTFDDTNWLLMDFITNSDAIGALVVEGFDLEVKFLEWG